MSIKLIKNKFDILLVISGIIVFAMIICNIYALNTIKVTGNQINENLQRNKENLDKLKQRTICQHKIYKSKYKLKFLNTIYPPICKAFTDDPISNYKLIDSYKDSINSYTSKINFVWEDYLDNFEIFKPFDEDTIYFSCYAWEKLEEIYKLTINGKVLEHNTLDGIILPFTKKISLELEMIYINGYQLDTLKSYKTIYPDKFKNLKKYTRRKLKALQNVEEHIFSGGF